MKCCLIEQNIAHIWATSHTNEQNFAQIVTFCVIEPYFSLVVHLFVCIQGYLRSRVYVYIHVTCGPLEHTAALSLNMARCFASLFSRHISQTFHSQRFKIQQNHQTHYDWSECQPQIELKYFLFVSYVKMYSICQISTTARVCRGFAKDVAIIHINCYLNLLWGRGWCLLGITHTSYLSQAPQAVPV